MTTDSTIPASHVCILACDMPRRLAAAFLMEVCSWGSHVSRQAAAYLDRVELPESDALPAELPDHAVAEMARILAAHTVRTDPDLTALKEAVAANARLPLLIELVKLDQKLRWSRGTPVFLEWYIESLPQLRSPETLKDLLRSECLARRFFDRLPEFSEIASRFPDAAGTIDLLALSELISELEHSPVLFQSTRFELIRKLGEGGMGQVYEVFDREQQMRVALKTMTRSRPGDLYRFKQEFRSLADIVHPNLVRLHELVSDGRTWLYTMELVPGEDFRQWIRKQAPAPAALTAAARTLTVTAIMPETELLEPGGGMSSASFEPSKRAAETVDYDRLRDAVRQLVAGIHAVHQNGKLHRDLKPSNVLVQQDGRLVILDFGLVKEIHDPFGPASGGQVRHQIAGTLHYMSPEQAAGEHDELTPASDWYSAGVMLFEAITGTLPFSGSRSEVLRKKVEETAPRCSSLAPDTPADLDELCARLLSRAPEDRPDGVELIALTGGGVGVAPIESNEPALPFVGRRDYIRRLWDGLAVLDRFGAAIIHVHGPSGSGKSALIQQFLKEARAAGSTAVISGRCYEQESVPYKALDSLIDALVTFLIRLPQAECAQLVPPGITALASIFPVLRRVRSIDEMPVLTVPDPLELRRIAFQALNELLSAVSRQRRLILYIDDLQWGDSDSAALLADILGSSHPPRLLFLASYRPEQRLTSDCIRALPSPANQRSVAHVDELEVSPLAVEEAAELALAILGETGDNRAEAQRIATESGGLPFFVAELASQVRQNLVRTGSHKAFTELDLDEAIWNRIGSLAQEAQQLLGVAAVAGRPIPLRQLYQAARFDSGAPSAIETLRIGRLIRRSGHGLEGMIEPYHDRIRETVYSRLGADRKTAAHRELARSFRDLGADPETIALHFDGAGDRAEAATYFERAAERSSAALAFDRAAQLYGRVLDLRQADGEEARRLRALRADSLAKAGRGADAAREYLAAAEIIADDEAFRLRERAGYQFCISGLIAEGRETFLGVLKHLGLSLPASRKMAMAGLLRRRLWLMMRGLGFTERREQDVPRRVLDQIDLLWSVAGGLTVIDPIPAAALETQNLLLALKAGEPKRILRAMAWEASHVAMMGRWQAGTMNNLLNAAEGLARKEQTPYASAFLAMSRSVAAFFQMRPVDCQRHGDEAAAIFREHCAGAAWELDQSQTFAFWCCYFQGNLRELSHRLQGLLAGARERGSRLVESQVTTFGGVIVWLADDNPAEARRSLARVSDFWADVEYQVYHYTLATAYCEISLYEGKGVEAFDLVMADWPKIARALLLSVEVVWIYMRFLRSRTALLAAEQSPDPERYLAWVRKDIAKVRRARIGLAQGVAHQLEASLQFRSGDRAGAVENLGRAAEAFAEDGYFLYQRGCLHARARLMGAAGLDALAEQQQWWADEGVKNPLALSRVFTPGFRLA